MFNKYLVTKIKCAIFVAKFSFHKEMAHIRHIRMLVVAVLVMASFVAIAQGKSDINARINRQGKVSVQAPSALSQRNNNDLNRDSKKSGRSDEVDATNLDEVKDKKDDKREENRPPRRNHTTQQSIQARGVGYRIQAFSDNNTATAKATAQQRARAIAMKFPQYRSYISYNAPSWRLRIGDFQKQEDAQKALQRVRAAFPAYGREMIIVRDKINVWGN